MMGILRAFYTEDAEHHVGLNELGTLVDRPGGHHRDLPYEEVDGLRVRFPGFKRSGSAVALMAS
jgi:hypothetical protein